MEKPVLGNGRKARLTSVSSHSNVGVTHGDMLARACLSRGAERRTQSHRGATAVCNVYVQADLTCAGNVVTLCAVQSYFSGTLAPFEQHWCRANVAACFVVTASALELGNDIKYLISESV